MIKNDCSCDPGIIIVVVHANCECNLARLKRGVLVQFLDKYIMYKCMIHLASALPALCRQYRYPVFRGSGAKFKFGPDLAGE